MGYSRKRNDAAMVATVALMAVAMVSWCFVAAEASAHDGRPRPAGVADAPSAIYGPLPQVVDVATNKTATCIWYGFRNVLYSLVSSSVCMADTWTAIRNSNPAKLEAFAYYTLLTWVDKRTNDSYCYVGCFDMVATSPTSAPAPSPPTTTPSPVPLPPPPSPVVSPPPSPVVSPPPSPVVYPPPPPPTRMTPPAASPPPPLVLFRTRHSAGSPIRPPTGLASFALAGALVLALHQLAAAR